jgi:hypothetical protein
MFKASKSTNLYNLPIHASSFGVGVEAATIEAIVTIAVIHIIKSAIYFSSFSSRTSSAFSFVEAIKVFSKTFKAACIWSKSN